MFVVRWKSSPRLISLRRETRDLQSAESLLETRLGRKVVYCIRYSTLDDDPTFLIKSEHCTLDKSFHVRFISCSTIGQFEKTDFRID